MPELIISALPCLLDGWILCVWYALGYVFMQVLCCECAAVCGAMLLSMCAE